VHGSELQKTESSLLRRVVEQSNGLIMSTVTEKKGLTKSADADAWLDTGVFMNVT
jgi:hypothetical protein